MNRMKSDIGDFLRCDSYENVSMRRNVMFRISVLVVLCSFFPLNGGEKKEDKKSVLLADKEAAKHVKKFVELDYPEILKEIVEEGAVQLNKAEKRFPTAKRPEMIEALKNLSDIADLARKAMKERKLQGLYRYRWDSDKGVWLVETLKKKT